MKWTISIFTLLFLLSCNKSEWKEPVDINFVVDVLADETVNGNLIVASGSLVVREIEFSGLREQADDVYFEEEFEESGKIISFANTTSNTDLSFTVPQGTYSLIRIDLEAESDEYNSIQFLGAFTQSNGEELPFLLELEELRFDDKVAKNSQGNTEINIISGTPATARIVLQPSSWFSTISLEELEDADTYLVNNVQTVVISEEKNDDLYDRINDKVNTGIEIVFQ